MSEVNGIEVTSRREPVSKDIKDMVQWLRDAPTPEMRKYRLEVVRDALSGKPIINEEYDTLSPPNEPEPLHLHL